MEPEAYTKGVQSFYGRDFQVDKRTYVPNKETEFLLSSLLKELKDFQTVIDVGTGCGNIAITLKLEKPRSNVYGVDISAKAIQVAIENARLLKADVNLFVGSYVDNKELPEPDFIIADLPWGSPATILKAGGANMLKYMPKEALFHPDGILAAQRELIKSIQKRGWHPKVFMETGLLTKEQVEEIIPEGIEWNFIKEKDYSITVLKL